jgi:hypothetical protein
VSRSIRTGQARPDAAVSRRNQARVSSSPSSSEAMGS